MSEHSFGNIIRKSGTYAVAILATRALSFILIPLYTRYLTTADYGVLELLDLSVNFIIVIAGLRLGQALFYYYFAEPQEDARQRHMSTNVLASVLVGAIVAMVSWFLSARLSAFVFGTAQYAPLFRLTAVSIGLAIPMETFLCCVRTFNEPGMYAGISIARTIIAGVLNVVLLVWFHLGVASMLWSGIVSQGLIVAVLSVHTFRRVPLRFDFGSFRKQAAYSFPLSLGGIGEFILNYGDRYFLRQTVSLSAIGVYSLAYKIGMVIPLVQYPFQLYWGSQEVNIVRMEGGWKIFTRVATYLTLGLTAVTVLMVLFVHPILHLMVPPGFREAGRYAGWIAMAYLIRAVGGYSREIFVIEKRPDLDAWVSWSGTIVVLAGYAILIPRMGLWGAVWATVGGFAAQFFFSFFVSQRVRRLDYEYPRLGKIVVCSIAAIAVYAAIAPSIFWMQVVVALALTVLWSGLLLATNLLYPSERDYVKALWRRWTNTEESAPVH
jgi:O-antigen/teichoic acid export membrane protein